MKEIDDEDNLYNIKIRTTLWIKFEGFKIDIKNYHKIKLIWRYIISKINEIYYLNFLESLLKAINIIIKMF